MLEKVIESCKYVSNNSKYVKINEKSLNEFISSIKQIQLTHWLSSSPYGLLEIPIDKIKVIVDQAGIIIENSKENKPYLFDMKIINKFINTSTEYILSNLKDIGVI